jgi:hypothetical protein
MKRRRSLYARPAIVRGEDSNAPRRSLDAECHRGAAWLQPWPESRWQCLPPSSPGCQSPQAAPASPNPRTAVRERAASSRWSGMPGRLSRRPASARATVWRPLSCPAVPGPTVRVAGVHGPAVRCPAVRCPAVRCPAVRLSKPSGVQPSGCPAIWCPPRPPSPRAARRSAQLDLEQVTPAEAWVGRRASIGRDLTGVVGLRLWPRSTG